MIETALKNIKLIYKAIETAKGMKGERDMATITICDRCKQENKNPEKMIKIEVKSETVEKVNATLEICDKCYAELSYTFNDVKVVK